jgi:2,3-bisphosphoglycerate-independent phosphoglycerate mutase
MKYIVIIGDGMADDPLLCKDGRTPMMTAHTPHMDMLASRGRCGRFAAIPADMPAGSEVANLGILGYDLRKVYQGRGVLEAASMGVDIRAGELGMRCNLICIEDGRIKNHSAGHIGSAEAAELIRFMNEALGNEKMRFYPGVSYRHLLVLEEASADVVCIPPHDVPGTLVEQVMPRAGGEGGRSTAELIDSLIRRSWPLLSTHPVNLDRRRDGKDPANSIWPWSPGFRPAMATLQEMFGVRGAVISAVDLINGIGVYAGMDMIRVEGATGLYDTNYEGKADACLESLDDHDFVYLHVEASDEAGHEGDFDLKVRTIEYLDRRLIGRILHHLGKSRDRVRIAVLPDHPTPVQVRTHTHDPVPFLICDLPEGEADRVQRFDENSVNEGGYGLIQGSEFISTFFGRPARIDH